MADTDRLLVIPLPDGVARKIQSLDGIDDWVERAEQTHFLVGLLDDTSTSKKRSRSRTEQPVSTDVRGFQEQSLGDEVLESPSSPF